MRYKKTKCIAKAFKDLICANIGDKADSNCQDDAGLQHIYCDKGLTNVIIIFTLLFEASGLQVA